MIIRFRSYFWVKEENLWQGKPFGTELLLYLFKLNPTGTKFSIILPGPPTDFGTKWSISIQVDILYFLLKKEYNCNVGYSGHENGVVVSLAAVMLGITSLERHITLDRTMYGSDQAASMEPNGFSLLVKSVRKARKALGSGQKLILNEENEIIIKNNKGKLLNLKNIV